LGILYVHIFVVKILVKWKAQLKTSQYLSFKKNIKEHSW
jgi:hypothetical protein